MNYKQLLQSLLDKGLLYRSLFTSSFSKGSQEENSGRDSPDARDYTAELFGSSSSDKPINRLGEGMRIYNQGTDDATKMACGSYSVAHASNAMNRTKHEARHVRPDTHWTMFVKKYKEEYAKENLNPITDGSYLQDQVSFARERGFITGRYKCRNVEDIKNAIDRQRAVVTGSTKINWRETRKAPYVAQVSSGAAHLFSIVGYNDLAHLLICANSYGPAIYDRGYFYVRYEDFDALYTCYALLDRKEEETLQQVQVKLQLARVVMQMSDGDPSSADYELYGPFIEYRKRTGGRK